MREDGPERFAELLRDESLREKIKGDSEFIAWSKSTAGGNAPQCLARVCRKRVAEIARMHGKEPGPR